MYLSKQHQSNKKALILTFVTVLALPLVLPFQKAAAFTFTKVVDFNGTNGAEPKAGVVKGAGSDSNLYGTTSQGGSSGNNGTAFKLSGSTLTTLINFAGTNSPKGSNPVARLFQASDGNFYGVALKGGANNLGSLFKLTSPSFTTLTTLFDFTGSSGSNLGSFPAGRLIAGSDGNLWGTTSGGGTNNLGTVFKIPTSGGSPTIVATFNGTNGSAPLARLQLGSDGKYYGTASEGGSANRGVVFKLDATTSPATLTVASFSGTNGANPQSGLIESSGYLYGTAKLGGASNNGAIFRIPVGFTSGTAPTLVASFSGSNGAEPTAALTPGATSGVFYGTASAGGANGTGVIYQLTTGTSTITTLYSFSALGSGNVGGAKPESTLISVGTAYYGTASNGGAYGLGTVFQFTP